ncbi:hypothetical protein MMC07_009939, partial [Pseudocyphellaria aurata]|nr:hypothetical protein [Pseudocyphellaria aurata]
MESADYYLYLQMLPGDLLPNRYLPQEPDADFPRLVDTVKFPATRDLDAPIPFDDPHVPDMIVTLLYKYDKRVLQAFLDPEFENIAFYCMQKSPRDDDFFIEKNGSSIME